MLHRILLLTLLLLGLSPLARAQEDDPDTSATPNAQITPAEGRVTIPLDRFLALTRKHHSGTGSEAGTAPVHFLFSRGDFRLTVRDRWVRVEGDMTLEVYSGSWVQVPLLSQDVVLEEARLDGKPLLVSKQEGHVVGLVRSSGSHRVNLTYYLPLKSAGPTRSFGLATPSAAVSSVHLELPGKDIQVNTQPRIPWSTRVAGGHTWLDGALPASTDTGVTFSWTPMAANPALQGKVQRQAPRIYARLYTLATLSERDVRLNSRIDLSILRNELDRVQLQVPQGVEVVDVQSDKLAGWSVSESGSQRTVDLRFSEPISGEHGLTVIYEKPVDLDPEKGKDTGTWGLPALTVMGVERVKGSLGVQTTGGVEATQSGLQEALAVDVQELPSEVSQMTSNPVTLAFEYHKQPFQISLKLSKGEEVPVLTAAIDRAEGLTLVTEEGKLVTTFSYTVRNNRKQFLQFELPPKANVYGTFVNGHAAKPVQGDKGELRLPLITSGASPEGSFPVEITYVQEVAAGQLYGTDLLIAPKLDVPVCDLGWSVYLPTGQEVFSTGGSVSPGVPPQGMALASSVPASYPQYTSVTGLVLPDDAMDQDSAARGGAAPSRSERKKAMLAGKLRASNTPAAQAQYFKDDNRLAQMVQRTSQGAFPVRVEIPKAGQLLQFSQLIVVNEAPTVLLHYFSAPVRTALWLAVVALVSLLGLSQVKVRSSWRIPAGGLLLAWLLSDTLRGTPLAFLLSAWNLAMLVCALGWLVRQRSQFKWPRRASAALLVLGLLAGSAPAHADPPGAGTVTLSLKEFLRLTHSGGEAGGPTQKPPAPCLMTGGSYRIVTGPAWAEVQADIGVALLEPGWQELDLLPSSVVLKSCRLDGKAVAIFPKADRYHCLLKGEGSHKLQLEYHLPVSGQSLSLVRPPTQVSSVHLVLPGTVKVQAVPETPMTTHSQGGKTVAEGALPPQDEPVKISWTAESSRLDRPRGAKPRLSARVYSLVTVSETVARVKHQVVYQIQGGEVDSLTLTVPAGVEVVEATCPNIAGWSTSDRGNSRVVTVALNQPATGSLAVTLVGEAPLAKIDATWDLPSLQVAEVERVKGSIGVEAGGGIEVNAVEAGLQAARPVDVQELPSELTQMTDKPLVLAYEYNRQPYQVSVESRKGKEVAVLTASIDHAWGTSLFTSDGKLVTTMDFQIRNNHKQHLELELPAGAQLWSSYVNGKAVKPVKADKAKMRLPLAASVSRSDGMDSFPAQITYAQEFPASSTRLELITPKVDMPISELSWQTYLPTDWVVWSSSGSLKATDHWTDPPAQAVAAAPPPVPQPPGRALRQEVEAQEGAETRNVAGRMQNANMVIQTPKGVLPVQINVPRVGQVLRFSRLMVTEESSNLVLTIGSRSSQRWAAWMLFGVLLVGGAWLASRPIGGLVLVILIAVGWLAASLLPYELAQLVPIPALALNLSLALWLLANLGLLGRAVARRLASTGSTPQPVVVAEPEKNPE